ncbi:invertebrate-type lysozyme 6-like [Centruroides vittatus]|uniref:invertebrate-type lysozyme 6-like n=1 Tax=Centruroides vittatus TaxID=120091 RepID=UPI00350F2237
MKIETTLFVTFILITVNIFCTPDILDRRCLNCFCQAQTECDTSFQCLNESIILCGPYLLGYAFWVDGHKPGRDDSKKDFDNFKRCSKNKACAEETIQNYMNEYRKDCNDNNIVDCADYFLIILGGPNSCDDKKFEERLEWLRFLECYLNTAMNIEEALISAGLKNIRF